MNHPNKLIPPQVQAPPSEDRLKLMLANGPDLVDVVQGLIDKFKLPYTIEFGVGNLPFLRDTLSAGDLWLKKFVTVHPDTVQMKEYARLMAKSPYDVLITGETGTGKELIANSMIADRKGPTRSVNCAGFPESLIESELFGHEKGSFTGADTRKVGLMQSATDGILFLDEIGELPMSVQAKLLRALQEKKVRKVGSNVEEVINCKFVCATHRNLKDMVKQGLFRMDLYARISTLELDILPLRERMVDVIPIAESIKDSKKFLEVHSANLMNGLLDLSLNVRSIQQHIIRFNVLGRVLLVH